MSDKTLLVTGGRGFVMSNLARAWLETDPQAHVVLLDPAPLDGTAARFFTGLERRLTQIEGDVARPASWAGQVDTKAITHVAHGAAVTSIQRLTARGGLAAARKALEVNVMGTFELLAWAQRLPRLRRFINVSSGSVYGGAGPEDGAPLPEEGYVDPRGLYPVSKRAGELLCRAAAEDFALPAVTVRLSGVYGPMDRETPSRDVKSPPYLIATLGLAGKPIRITALDGAGDFIHVGDVARALLGLLEADRLGYSIYNIAYGKLATLRDLLDIAREKLPDLRSEIVAEQAADIRLDPALTQGRWGAYDISRLAEDIGWRPSPLRQALHSYIDWLREQD